MKRPRQSAVRQNAGPLALFSFVVNVTASFFRQFSRHISTWEKELNRRRQTLKPLKIKAFSVCRYYTVMAYGSYKYAPTHRRLLYRRRDIGAYTKRYWYVAWYFNQLEAVTAQYVNVRLERKKLSLKPTTKPCTRRSPRRIKAASRKSQKEKQRNRAVKTYLFIAPRCFLYAFKSSGHHSGTTAYIFYE